MTGGEEQFDFSFLGENFDEDSTNTADSPSRSEQQREVAQPNERNTAESVRRLAQEPTETQTGQAPEATQQQQVDTNLTPIVNTPYFVNSRGDITDRNGGVLAHHGNERRLFYAAQRGQETIANLTAELERVKVSQVQGGEADRMAQQHGLTSDEVRESMGIVAEFKRNPAAAARNVVERAMALGHSLQDILGSNAQEAVETGAIQRMLDAKLKPITDQFTTQQRQQQTDFEAQQAMTAFLNAHEYSNIHANAISRLMQSNQFTPERAYYELRQWAAVRGLDFSKPLGPQVAALANESAQQPQVNGQQPRVAPMVRGAGSGTAATAPVTDQPVAYSEHDDWKTILRREIAAQQ